MRRTHRTPSYIVARLKQLWFEKRNPDAPWLTSSALEHLSQLLKPTDFLIEFGSGRSTAWFAQRCVHITSVEHDPQWYSQVSERVSQFRNIKYQLKSINSDGSGISPYTSILDSFDDASIDVIVNDGRLRDEVAVRSLPKVRPGGLIVLDNAERYLPNDFAVPESRKREDPTAIWREFHRTVLTWRYVWTCNGVTTTLLLFKPC